MPQCLLEYNLTRNRPREDVQMNSFQRTILLAVFACHLAAQQPLRSLPDNNLGYPVMINIGRSTGSGFFFNTGQEMYLVTATHVLYSLPEANRPRTLLGQNIDLLSYSADIADTVQNRIRIDTTVLGEANILRHATADVTVVRMFNIIGTALRTLPGVTIQRSARAGILSAHVETVARFNQVLVGNDVFLFGYPLSLNLALQLDPERPLVSKGIVGGINRFSRSIILNCPSYPGNSGGPAVEVDPVDALNRSARIIGVVDQFIPFADATRGMGAANSGYSVIVPIDFALDLMNVH